MDKHEHASWGEKLQHEEQRQWVKIKRVQQPIDLHIQSKRSTDGTFYISVRFFQNEFDKIKFRDVFY
jgi:hypothetical protein